MSNGFEETREGGQRALSEIYDRYAGWFRARLIKRFGREDAEDLLQETWLRLAPYQSIGEIRHPRALLMRIASNLAADRTARRMNRLRHAAEISRSDGWGLEMPRQAAEVLAKQLVLGLPEPLRDVATVVDCYLALTAGQGVTNSRQCRPRGAGR